jgi:hypothetical protein
MIRVFRKVGFYIQLRILDFLEKVTLRRTIKLPSIKGEPRRKKNGRLKKVLLDIARG